MLCRWRDDIWTVKYLPGFKWEMLGEQVGKSTVIQVSMGIMLMILLAYERQAHQSRLRAEIARSKTEQGEYLRNVELARVLEKRKAKKAASGSNGTTGAGGVGSVAKGAEDEDSQPKKGYRQRQVVEKARGMEGKGMESVLESVFG